MPVWPCWEGWPPPILPPSKWWNASSRGLMGKLSPNACLIASYKSFGLNWRRTFPGQVSKRATPLQTRLRLYETVREFAVARLSELGLRREAEREHRDDGYSLDPALPVRRWAI